jgi:hypothetical protein
MPAGVDVIVPEPVPVRVMIRLKTGGGDAAKLAVQIESALTTMVALANVPAQTPDQPVNVEPTAEVAVSVTVVPCATLELHTLPQATPAGVEFTVPVPVPARLTVRVNCGVGMAAKVAMQVAFDVMTMDVFVPVPVHAPDQPANVEPLLAVATSVTAVFCR